MGYKPTLEQKAETLIQRFFDKIYVDESDCWVWNSSLFQKTGYGCFRDIYHNKISSHRFSYELFNGRIPDDKQLDHLCRNRKCVNPDHLEAVTRKTNILRGQSPMAINSRKTHCPKGHQYSGYNIQGRRVCIICDRESSLTYYYKNRSF